MQIQVHIINNNDKSSIRTPWFLYYIGSLFNISCNLFRKDWDAVLLERLLGRRLPVISIWSVTVYCIASFTVISVHRNDFLTCLNVFFWYWVIRLTWTKGPLNGSLLLFMFMFLLNLIFSFTLPGSDRCLVKAYITYCRAAVSADADELAGEVWRAWRPNELPARTSQPRCRYSDLAWEVWTRTTASRNSGSLGAVSSRYFPQCTSPAVGKVNSTGLLLARRLHIV